VSLKENKIPCFILAGGKSSRFGKDKSKIFYKHQYELCKKVFKKVYFVAKEKKFKKYPFFIEKSKKYAPIFALEEIIKKHKKVFVLNIDTPLVNPNDFIKLIQKKAVAKDNPLIGYYDYTMLKNFNKKTLKIYGINKKQIQIKNSDININKKEDLLLLPYKIRKSVKI
jgi:molybdopterin-guanine dinucleotide biosynthesis protein A